MDSLACSRAAIKSVHHDVVLTDIRDDWATESLRPDGGTSSMVHKTALTLEKGKADPTEVTEEFV